MKSSQRICAATVLCVVALGLLLSGCNGIPTQGEKTAREQVKQVAAEYRPHDKKPALPVLTPESGLSNFLAYALLKHPNIEAAYYDWIASVQRITQARSFPDPQFTFQMDVQNAITSLMPGLMGNIPWPSKLRVGAAIAQAQSQAKYFAYKSAVLQTAFELKRVYYHHHFLFERIRVNQEILGLLDDMEKLARAQNEVGKGTLQDVLRTQIEADRLRTEITNLEDSHTSLMAEYKAALGMTPDDPFPPMPTHIEFTSLDVTSEQLLDTAFAQNQRLKGMESDIRAADAAIALARKSRLPDFSLGFMGDAKTDPTLYRFPGNPGTMTLPIWRDKIAAQIAEAQANKRAAEARLSAEQISLAVDFAQRTYQYREAMRNLELLNNQLLPKARQSLEVARSAYLAGQIDFFNLLDSERTLLALQLDKVEASTQREVVLAELSLIIQGMSPVSAAMGGGGSKMGASTATKKSGGSGM
ncbi:MAG: hypothetical protein C5B50_08200 [Verrucomicrobia bacterium]|nr:MAG: hypothetical protein C5B50_08200 [Verrucomicrobiota bacterium]